MPGKKRADSVFEKPAYGVNEAAHYLQMAPSTLRDWTKSHRYLPDRAVIRTPQAGNYLSFNNLIEAHVLHALRMTYQLSFSRVRDALRCLFRDFRSDRPLLHETLSTDKIDLFVESHGELFRLASKAQLSMKPVLHAYLERIEKTPRNVPVKLFPVWRREDVANHPRHVVIDPLRSFGRPILVNGGVPTAPIFDRFMAGDPIHELARDYGAKVEEIEEAIRCEQVKIAA